ncbi:MAG: hypothetical protein RIQ70_234 [Bacteroidota bacterium]|jgi:hypothetical protein
MNKELILIEGTFSPEDAREVLMNAYTSKINFHNLKNLTSFEMVGKEDELAVKRIAELKSVLSQVRELIAEAKEKDMKLVIHSTISIKGLIE